MKALRFAIKQLAHNPAFGLFAVLTFAVGIGASAVILSVVDGILLEPLPYHEPDRIVELREITEQGFRPRLSDPNYFDIRDETRSFVALAQYGAWKESVAGGSEPVRAVVAAVSREFFDVLRVQPALGRAFVSDEQREGAAPAALVSHDYWQRHLSGTPDWGSRTLRIADRVYSIVGVLPAGFDYPDGADVWSPRELWPDTPGRQAHNWFTVGRLADGVTLDQSRTELRAIAQRLKAVHGDDTDMADVSVVQLHEAMIAAVRPALLVLAAGAALLFFVACANVVSMLLARMVARENEIAVRAALGAGRLRLVRQFFAEALVVCAAGCVAGIVLAWWGLDLTVALGRDLLPRTEQIALDWSTVGAAALLTLAAATVLSVVAAWRLPGEAALHSGRRTIAGGGRSTLREGLVAVQIALALVLVVGGALLGKSFVRVAAVDPGLDTAGIVFMTLTLPFPQDEAAQLRLSRTYERIIDRLRELPGVEAVGGVSSLPLTGGGTNGQFLEQNRVDEISDWDSYAAVSADPARTGYAEWRIASEDYFDAVGIPLLRGRVFERGDVPGGVHAAVVSRSLAERTWPNEDPIGKLINFGGMDANLTPLRVVGVVGDIRDYGLDSPARDTVYAFYQQRNGGHLAEFSIALRAPNAAALVPAARDVVREITPDVPPEFASAGELFSRTLAQRRFNLVMLGAFGGTALLLALAGVYGAIAFSVAQRTNEIGVRIALGAQRPRVIAMVLRKTLLIAAIGIAAGLVAAYGGSRLVASLLYGVSPHDPATYGAAAAALLIAAVGAAWLPALRAARVDPMTALRHD